MLIQGQVGPSSAQSVQPGSTPNVRLGQQGDLIASELHGRYYEQTYRKAVYTGATTAVQTTAAGVTTSLSGLSLYNPIASPVNLVVNKVGIAFVVAFGTASGVGLMTAQSFTAISTFSTTGVRTAGQFVGQPQGYGVVYATATAPVTPAVTTILAAGLTGAITTVPVVQGLYDLEGSLLLPPGAYASIYTTNAVTSGLWASFQWEEVPI